MNEPVAPDTDPNMRRDGSGEPDKTGPHKTDPDKTDKAALSGAKGFAIILGAMLGIIGLLWLVAALVAPN
jgi:hypothetical protein